MAEGAAPQQHDRLPCDLVMKGGITSGVVYPAAIKRLSETYSFRSIGGASAGAIAAVTAAACEYRRREGDEESFAFLDEVNAQLTQPGFIQGLFQPTPAARPAFDLLLAFVGDAEGRRGRVVRALAATLRAVPGAVAVAATAVLAWIAVVAVVVAGLADAGLSGLEVVALVLVAIVSLVALAAVLVAVAAWVVARFVGLLDAALRDNRLGICSGARQAGSDGPALTEWLHETIQRCAGLDPEGPPLSFEMLSGADPDRAIELRFVTTDLSYSRPVDLPLSDDPASEGETTYYFDRGELARLFPAGVIAAMTAGEVGTELVDGREHFAMPGAKLPIVVAARLSLSFPILLSTVPLWSQDERLPEPVEHAMSDGGITSNFPIHFFDTLLPRRPTFGLDLQPYPDPRYEPELVKAPPIAFGDDPRLPSFTAVGDLFTFARQILSAALDWRDTLQAELPGFRDRVCQIRLSKREGGLNLNMAPEVVEALEERGRAAGEAIATRFDWDCHRFTRYLTFMQVLQERLGAAQPALAELVAQVPQIPSACHSYPGHEPPWWDTAHPLTTAFLAGATWGEDGTIDFAANAPTPTAPLRVTPDV